MKALLIGGVVIILGGVGVYAFMQKSDDAAMIKQGNESVDKMEDKSTDAMVEDHAAMKDQTDEAMMKHEDTSMEKDGSDAMVKTDSAMMEAKEGTYVPYDSAKVASAAKDGHAVLFFRASWCPTCRAVDSDIKANLSSIPKGLTIFDVNYDSETALKQKYAVTYQHTFVEVDENGNLIKKWSGSPTLAALSAEVI